MNQDSASAAFAPPWFVEWMREAGLQSPGRSLVLATSREPGLAELSCALASYLNEFDGERRCEWRAFDRELLGKLARDPLGRKLVLAGGGGPSDSGEPRSDLDLIVRRLARLGSAVVETSQDLSATADLPDAFCISLTNDAPASCPNLHMWLNPARFGLRSLVCIIADSFLNWTTHLDSRLVPAKAPPAVAAIRRDR